MPTKGRFKDNPGTFGRYQDLEVTGRLIGPQFSRIFASIDRLASADIERGSITADKLSADVFNAIIATIRDSISIGPGTGFTGYTGTGDGGANEQTRIQFPYSSTVDFGGEYLILYTPTESWGFWFQKSGTDVEPPAWTVDHAVEVDITASASPSLARTQLTAALNAQAADWTATNPGDGYVYATSVAAGACTDAVSSNETLIVLVVAVQGSEADEGDRRAYLDQDEFRVQEYRSGAWVTVALLGGTDSELYVEGGISIGASFVAETIKALDGDGLKLFEDGGTKGLTILDSGVGSFSDGLSTESIAAEGAAGLTLYDDGGNVGLFVKDGAAGRIGLGTTDVEAWDADFHAVLESTKEAIVFGDDAGGPRVETLVNSYRDTSAFRAKITQEAGRWLVDNNAVTGAQFSHAPSVSADAEQTFVAHLIIRTDSTDSQTTLALGGGAGGADRNMTIWLASDASIFWDESTGDLSFDTPATIRWTKGGSSILRHSGTELFFVNANTTGTANMIKAGDTVGSAIKRTTSSLAYKQDVRYSVPDELLDRFRSITFRSRCDGDDQTINRYGFGAEDMAALGDPALYAVDPDTGKPNGVEWNAVVSILVARVQKHEARLISLEGATK